MTDETPLPQGGGVLLWGKSLPDNLLFVGPGPTGPDRTQAALRIQVLALDRPDALIETRAAACGTGRNWRTRIDAACARMPQSRARLEVPGLLVGSESVLTPRAVAKCQSARSGGSRAHGLPDSQKNPQRLSVFSRLKPKAALSRMRRRSYSRKGQAGRTCGKCQY